MIYQIKYNYYDNGYKIKIFNIEEKKLTLKYLKSFIKFNKTLEISLYESCPHNNSEIYRDKNINKYFCRLCGKEMIRTKEMDSSGNGWIYDYEPIKDNET